MTQLLGMRLTSAVYGAINAALAFLLVLELLRCPGARRVPAGRLVGFEPMFAFVSGAVNNDNGVNMMAALVIYLMVRGLRRGLSPGVGAGLGAALSIAPLMKGTVYELYPAVAIGLVALLVKHRRRTDLLG